MSFEKLIEQKEAEVSTALHAKIHEALTGLNIEELVDKSIAKQEVDNADFRRLRNKEERSWIEDKILGQLDWRIGEEIRKYFEGKDDEIREAICKKLSEASIEDLMAARVQSSLEKL